MISFFKKHLVTEMARPVEGTHGLVGQGVIVLFKASLIKKLFKVQHFTLLKLKLLVAATSCKLSRSIERAAQTKTDSTELQPFVNKMISSKSDLTR